MKRNYYKIMLLVILALALTAVVGCLPTEMNGGGWIPSTSGNPGDRANFGFWANSCDSDVIGNFNFHDMYADGYGKQGVKLNGAVTEAAECSEEGSEFSDECIACKAYQNLFDSDNADNVYAVEFSYDSTNPNNRGSGHGFACLVNNGQGINAEADEILINVESGPYGRHRQGRRWVNGYSNYGHVQGNISTQSCPE